MHSLTGQFLVSMPRLRGSLFEDSLIYLWSHDDDGARGIIVNHAYDITLTKLFDELEIPARGDFDTRVAAGGPVEPQRGYILHSDEVQVESSESAGEGLAMSFSREILELIGGGRGPSRFLVSLGCSGWGPGQLERELEDSAWLTAPASQETLFEVPLEQRMDRVASVLGIDWRLLGADAGIA